MMLWLTGASWIDIYSPSDVNPDILQDATADDEYLACGLRYSFEAASISELQMIWCHEFTLNKAYSDVVGPGGASTEVPCPSDHFVSGIDVKYGEPTSGYAYIDYGATFIFSTSYDSNHENPNLNGGGVAYHGSDTSKTE